MPMPVYAHGGSQRKGRFASAATEIGLGNGQRKFRFRRSRRRDLSCQCRYTRTADRNVRGASLQPLPKSASVLRVQVRNRQGTMVSLSELVKPLWMVGAPRLDRYNGVPSVKLSGCCVCRCATARAPWSACPNWSSRCGWWARPAWTVDSAWRRRRRPSWSLVGQDWHAGRWDAARQRGSRRGYN